MGSFLTTENRIPERHGGVTFDGVELVLQEDGSITLGSRRAMTKKQTVILKLVHDLYTVVQALVNHPDQKWNASSLKKLLTGDNNNKSAVLLLRTSKNVIKTYPIKFSSVI